MLDGKNFRETVLASIVASLFVIMLIRWFELLSEVGVEENVGG